MKTGNSCLQNVDTSKGSIDNNQHCHSSCTESTVPPKSRLFLFSLLSLPAHIRANILGMQCVFVLYTHLSCTFFTSHGFNISLGDVVISLCWPLLLHGQWLRQKKKSFPLSHDLQSKGIMYQVVTSQKPLKNVRGQ